VKGRGHDHIFVEGVAADVHAHVSNAVQFVTGFSLWPNFGKKESGGLEKTDNLCSYRKT
jgi:hypothetical protein